MSTVVPASVFLEQSTTTITYASGNESNSRAKSVGAKKKKKMPQYSLPKLPMKKSKSCADSDSAQIQKRRRPKNVRGYNNNNKRKADGNHNHNHNNNNSSKTKSGTGTDTGNRPMDEDDTHLVSPSHSHSSESSCSCIKRTHRISTIDGSDTTGTSPHSWKPAQTPTRRQRRRSAFQKKEPITRPLPPLSEQKSFNHERLMTATETMAHYHQPRNVEHMNLQMSLDTIERTMNNNNNNNNNSKSDVLETPNSTHFDQQNKPFCKWNAREVSDWIQKLIKESAETKTDCALFHEYGVRFFREQVTGADLISFLEDKLHGASVLKQDLQIKRLIHRKTIFHAVQQVLDHETAMKHKVFHKCVKCSRIIKKELELLKQEDGYYHWACFACDQCDLPLGGTTYIEYDDEHLGTSKLCKACMANVFAVPDYESPLPIASGFNLQLE